MSLVQDVESRLLPHATKAKDIDFLKRYFNTQWRILGVPVPAQRKAVTIFIRDLIHSEKDWERLWWDGDSLEVMCLPLIHFGNQRKELAAKTYWKKLMKWAERIENWVHSDSLSSLYSTFLEKEPALVYPTLKAWNKSKHPWLRRQSIVSLFYYRSQREKVLPYSKTVSLLKPLIEDEHFYVQRGVGWTLREMGQAYPKETLKLLKEVTPRLSAVAFSAATEKILPSQKAALKRLR